MLESSKTNEVGESELTESESHLNRLKDGEMSLHTLLNPSLQPTKSSSTAVNMAVGVIGKCQAAPPPSSANICELATYI